MTLNHMMIAFIVDLNMNHHCWQDHDFEINPKSVSSYACKLKQISFLLNKITRTYANPVSKYYMLFLNFDLDVNL